jgi:hypothetical protein
MDLAVDLYNNTAKKAVATNKLASRELTDPHDLSQFNERCSIVLGVSKAEINHFHDQRVQDFQQMFKSFVSGQIQLHERMLDKLRTVQAGFE